MTTLQQSGSTVHRAARALNDELTMLQLGLAPTLESEEPLTLEELKDIFSAIKRCAEWTRTLLYLASEMAK